MSDLFRYEIIIPENETSKNNPFYIECENAAIASQVFMEGYFSITRHDFPALHIEVKNLTTGIINYYSSFEKKEIK